MSRFLDLKDILLALMELWNLSLVPDVMTCLFHLLSCIRSPLQYSPIITNHVREQIYVINIQM